MQFVADLNEIRIEHKGLYSMISLSKSAIILCFKINFACLLKIILSSSTSFCYFAKNNDILKRRTTGAMII